MSAPAPSLSEARVAAGALQERPQGARALIEAMRPRQWSKNVFVLAGIVFAGRLFELRSELRVLACFAIFCAAASAVYLANGEVHLSSMTVDVLRERPTEIDVLNGAVVECGRRFGIATPINEALCLAIKTIERTPRRRARV